MINFNSKKGAVVEQILKLNKTLTAGTVGFVKYCRNNTEYDIKDSDVSNAVMFFRECGYDIPFKREGRKMIYTFIPSELAKIDINSHVTPEVVSSSNKRRSSEQVIIDKKIDTKIDWHLCEVKRLNELKNINLEVPNGN